MNTVLLISNLLRAFSPYASLVGTTDATSGFSKMELTTLNVGPLRFSTGRFPPPTTNTTHTHRLTEVHSPFWSYLRHRNQAVSNFIRSPAITNARKNNWQSESVLKPTIIHEVSEDDDDDEAGVFLDDDELEEDESKLIWHVLVYRTEEFLDDGDDFEEYVAEDAEVYVGDGAEGGGISLAGTWWDKEALSIAEQVSESFDGDLNIYAFRTLANSTIQVRIEKLSTKSGSPSMIDIEAFTSAYKARLDEAELAKSIPENISLEVSSPGVERVVQIPHELDKFKERPMYVKYVSEVATNGSSNENDGVFRLISFDLETNCCTWGFADVRINREKAGRGRPLSKKQRDWRLTTPLDSLRLVRLYSEV